MSMVLIGSKVNSNSHSELAKALYSTENIELNQSNLSKENEQKHENIITIPNLLCISRVLAAPYLSHLIINQADFSWAMVIFMYAGLTDAVS